MRVMLDVIWDNNIHDQYHQALQADTAQDWDVDWDTAQDWDLDETSDVEDPEKKAKCDLGEYKREMADKETLFQIAVLEMARKSTADQQVHLDFERAQMEREDFRAQLLRAK